MKSINKTFNFGDNWMRYLDKINPKKIKIAKKSLLKMLKIKSLKGKSFIDIGCGSGLFSLAAVRLGAYVFSFDFDKKSVECASLLKKKYLISDKRWKIDHGSILNESFIKHIGKFDVVYSWGVLHHTGDMFKAIENSKKIVKKKGVIYLAIYNDQEKKSYYWKKIKKYYCNSSVFTQKIILLISMIILWTPSIIKNFIRLKPFDTFKNYESLRGMNIFTDLEDWVGGYPFEVAKPEVIVDKFLESNYYLFNLKTNGSSLGCNEFVFKKY
jgi:2-polyprenyl-3-methyl-5-hydroxy-6-metoxy-1,4-benzoquinol methylase